MVLTYNDPVKQVARNKLCDFIARNLLSSKSPKGITVVCFPGAEYKGEEALEVKEVYDHLGIPRKNIVGLEYDPETAQRLREANLGIEVVCADALDFFKTTNRTFGVISLDYESHQGPKEVRTLEQIAGRQRLYHSGVLHTNYMAKREAPSRKVGLLAKKAIADIIHFTLKDGIPDQNFIQAYRRMQDEGKTAPLHELRKNVTIQTLDIMVMGTSALYPIGILDSHPYSESIEEEIRKLFENVSDSHKEIIAILESVGAPGASSHRKSGQVDKLSTAYVFSQLEGLKMHFQEQLPHVHPDFIEVMVEVLVYSRKKAYMRSALERYLYNSNKNITMMSDMFAFRDIDDLDGLLQDIVRYDEKTSKVIFNPGSLNTARLQKKSEKFTEKLRTFDFTIDIPEQVYLGSSWQPLKRKQIISRDDAIDLLKSGCSPAEIADAYLGFTKMQLAAFKAHYVTMGKELKKD